MPLEIKQVILSWLRGGCLKYYFIEILFKSTIYTMSAKVALVKMCSMVLLNVADYINNMFLENLTKWLPFNNKGCTCKNGARGPKQTMISINVERTDGQAHKTIYIY